MTEAALERSVRSPAMSPRWPWAAVLLLAMACSGGGGDDDGASLGETLPPTAVTVPATPAASPSGTGVVVVGGTSSSFAVTECELAAPSDGLGTGPLVHVTGEGSTGSGVPFQVEIERFATGSDVQTFTDAVSYTDSARILQAQRFEVAGEVTDLRDPDATNVLLRIRDGGVSAAGLAGPPGAVEGEDEGIVGLAIDATC